MTICTGGLIDTLKVLKFYRVFPSTMRTNFIQKILKRIFNFGLVHLLHEIGLNEHDSGLLL